jgi:GTP pyrophosphokinase
MDKDTLSFSEKLQSYPREDRERILESLRWAEEDRLGTGQGSRGRPGEIASILIDLNLDADTLIAAVLRDAPVDNAAPREALEARFGRDALLLVEGVSRISGLAATRKTIQEAENIRKMLFAMVSDIRVIFIKLADKLLEMRNLGDVTREGQKGTAQECLDIYAPLADRLGISWMKDELEDLALKQLNREAYLQIKEIVALKKGERQDFLEAVGKTIKAEAAATGINIEVESRAKHFYSIYQKMRKRNKESGDLYDLFGLRILCDSIENCYTLLGLVHRLWKPLEGRFKDYIAMPKDNGYQSLHTTVMAFGGASGAFTEGQLLEIQIRTGKMHQVAEYGIASHWLYKGETGRGSVRPEDIPLINRLRNWKQIEAEAAGGGTGGGSESFLEDIKRELLKDSIYVFTPRGKVIELPAGATPIDFAYHIHSAIGEHCAGAKADGVIVPLSLELHNTQVVEILTSTAAHPHVNWLRIVKTAKARGKIRSWLQQNDDSVIIEKNVVAKKKPPALSTEPGSAGERVKEGEIQRLVPKEAMDANILRVRLESNQGPAEKNMMIRFARCCNPVLGDPIVGYVSRGRGIIVHRKNCSNLANIPDFAERRIDTEWENAAPLLVKRFKVESRMSTDLFSEIEGAVRKYQGHLIEGRLEETGANRLTGFFTMQLERNGDLKRVLKNIRGIPAIFNIQTLG